MLTYSLRETKKAPPQNPALCISPCLDPRETHLLKLLQSRPPPGGLCAVHIAQSALHNGQFHLSDALAGIRVSCIHHLELQICFDEYKYRHGRHVSEEIGHQLYYKRVHTQHFRLTCTL